MISEENSKARKPTIEEIDNWLKIAIDQPPAVKKYESMVSELALKSSIEQMVNSGLKVTNPPLNALSLPKYTNEAQTRYSRKVFVGGLPKTIHIEEIQANFCQFGTVQVDWPHRNHFEKVSPFGYAFLIFEDSSSVNKLIDLCVEKDSKFLIGIRSLDGGKHVVEVKAWDSKNIEIALCRNWQNFIRRTVFAGGIPRATTAGELAKAFQDAVGGVAYVCIDIEENTDYPKGAARVVFNNEESYIRALAMKQLTMATHGADRTAEIKPYMHGKMKCEHCNLYGATTFCPKIQCLKYFCDNCWKVKHSYPGMTSHKPMQKGHYLQSPKLSVPSLIMDGNQRRAMSSSNPTWLYASNSPNPISPRPSDTGMFSFDKRHFYHSSIGDSAFGASSTEISPAFAASSTDISQSVTAISSSDSVFDFLKH